MNPQEMITKGIKNPDRILPYLKRQALVNILPIYSKFYRRTSEIPDQKELINKLLYLNEEYVLVVLDACRSDSFESIIDDYLDGDFQTVWSPGSRTPEWGPNVWSGHYDLTYISSNPIIGDYEYSPRNNDFGYDTFCAADHFDMFIDAYNFSWDDELRTVTPSDMTDIALQEVARDKPTKLVVHYLQPHIPFIGNNSLSFYVSDHKDRSNKVSPEERQSFLEENSEITLKEKQDYNVTWSEELQYNLTISDSSERGYNALLREELVTEEQIYDGYMGNLELVLEEVQRLAQRVDCPVVITADHGELMGESGLFGHPSYHHPVLREVPWFEVNPEEIGVKENTHSPVEREHTGINNDGIESRLENLGYL